MKKIIGIILTSIAMCGCGSKEYKAAEEKVGAMRDSIESATDCGDLGRKLQQAFDTAALYYYYVPDSAERAKLDKQLREIDKVLDRKLNDLGCGATVIDH